MTLTYKLKEYTLESHQQLEKVLIQDLKSLTSISDYYLILRKFYGFIAPLEFQIEQFVDVQLLPDFHIRRKASSLIEDIKSLNCSVDNLSLSPHLPEISNKYQALGALYVIEGSTLGGQIISGMLKTKLGLTSKGMTFFEGYGEHTAKMWDEFKSVLDGSIEVSNHSEVVQVAENTFVEFKKWLISNA
ncbi:biliverdin-producing heme oxygenase [Pedobacter sp. SYSU D00535]|uniref:biliverdin-producing heme oxygenase n=1 Tax=Pedobacter sp. SYSU D00535 TaxID=2810308 RepID=UPI001A95DA9E|nr:biliverdin-producing heme oxygenase [Pedobacter sp. SYSU D00535]